MCVPQVNIQATYIQVSTLPHTELPKSKFHKETRYYLTFCSNRAQQNFTMNIQYLAQSEISHRGKTKVTFCLSRAIQNFIMKIKILVQSQNIKFQL